MQVKSIKSEIWMGKMCEITLTLTTTTKDNHQETVEVCARYNK